MESLDLVRVGANVSPNWSRVWPTPEKIPGKRGLELWMVAHWHLIVSGLGSRRETFTDVEGV